MKLERQYGNSIMKNETYKEIKDIAVKGGLHRALIGVSARLDPATASVLVHVDDGRHSFVYQYTGREGLNIKELQDFLRA
jgi:hypothetical protein